VSTNAPDPTLALPLLRARPSLVSDHSRDLSSAADTDEELLDRVRSKDEKALLILFRHYSRLAFSIGCRILRDKGEAEDLVQEIFLRLPAEANSFDNSKGSARTWMVQLVYRRAFDRRSYLHRRHFYNGTDILEHANALIGESDLEKDVIERLTTQQLRGAFDDLSEKQRETLNLFFFEGLKLREIAERFGADLTNVRHHYYRGLERLRRVAHEGSGAGRVSDE
jgi:RNA polymerase sigma-70 factor, ECF subfamily